MGFIGPAITIGTSLLGGLLGRPKQSQAEKDAIAGQAGIARQQKRFAGERGAREKAFFQQQQPLISKLINRFTALLGGDRTATAREFGPLLEDLAQQRKTFEQRIRQTTPGGGAQAQSFADLEGLLFGKRADILRGAPERGEAGLFGISQLLGQQAGQQAGASAAAGGVASGALQSILAAEGQQKVLSQEFFNSLVEGATDLGGGLFEKLFKKKTEEGGGDVVFPPGE